MILSSRRTLLEHDILDLPRWIRAPVYMNQGQVAYIALDPEAVVAANKTQDEAPRPPSDPRFVELVLSPFPPEIWGDLWRLKLETYDLPGNLNRIFEILARRNLEVLMSEGSTNSNGRRHEMAFVLSAKNYKSESDPKDTNARAALRTASLKDLQEELTIELIDVLTLYPDGRPKVNVRRIRTYHSLYERFTSKEIPRPISVMVEPDGRIVLPKAFSHDVRSRLNQRPNSPIHFSPAVDTTDRIVRLMCFPDIDDSPCYVQIVVPKHSNMVADVFKQIANPSADSDVKINVVRYQLRPGLGRTKREKAIGDDHFMRLDLTFVPIEPRKKVDLFKRLERRLKEIPNFSMSGCRITWVEGASKAGGRDRVLKSSTKARVQAAQRPKADKPAGAQRRRHRGAN